MADERKAVQPRGLPMRRPGPGGHPIGIPAEKAKDFRGTLKRLILYLKPYLLPIVIVLGLTIAATVLTIVAPKILGRATTEIFRGVMAKMLRLPNAKIDFSYVAKILMHVGLIYSLSGLLMYLQQFIMAGVSQKIVMKMRKDVSEKLARLPLKFYDSRTHGEILSRVINDIDLISNTLQQSLVQFVSGIVSVAGVTIMMLTISPLLTGVTLLTLPLSIVTTIFIAKHSQRFFSRQQKRLGELSGHVEEVYAGHIVVKAYCREKDVTERFENINEQLCDASHKAQFLSGMIMPLMRFIGNLGYVIVSVVGGILVTKRSITIGDVQAFIQYSQQFTQPIVQISNIANLIQSTIAAAERVFEILDEEEEKPEKPDALKIEKARGDVKFEGVYFSYVPEKPLIEDLNVEVYSGQRIAIVGPTGAGKTTLVNLLMRFYEIQKGSIKLDGIDIRDIHKSSLRKCFGMVLQDTWLFNGTIRENIAYGKENATEEEIIQAAKMAQAHHFIMALPDGYDTVINEEATNISYGEKQLITIARAFLANPDVLILDEATSNVDTLTEIYIQKAMDELMKGRTCFIIAHRLSTIKNADLILVMNEGKIIEKGTHKELLAKGGLYAELYRSQLRKPVAFMQPR
ncbi:MAG: ABC transporter related [Thermotoga sp. 50_1627]|uniref:ABC transporter ATP-binding protein n=1 Tax=Pseudothermotoga sp. TaxID=2033661 RepID=UPI00076C0717|nr:MAG: ABC transporter related [Thermotoga sp. 50_64]KUK24313.1 MAG: ABC transporter related [Thermotoga sp. 50_1627]MBC7117330.1 ABC transporter ATP-binding protein [Pseudothermotoga sp.]HBT39867.1 multidrug ABC transporter ATP-binding protein [Pseudothermotoga sp.]